MFRNLLYRAFGLLGRREVKALEAASRNPRATQEEMLLALLKTNAGTEYGRKHSFDSIKSISDFQRLVPINDYDSLSQYINKAARGETNVLTAEQPFMFATTSGTTGSRKLIPVTRAYIKEFRRASVVSGYNLLKNYPGVTKGVSLSVFSPAQESLTDAGIPCGAISGRLYMEEPPLMKKYISPIPYEVFLIEDYDSRYYTLLRCALMLPISSIYTLNPSTIVLLARKLRAFGMQLIDDVAQGTLSPPSAIEPSVRAALEHLLKPDPARAQQLYSLLQNNDFNPPKIWPQLSLICCWTRAAAAFYLQDFPEYFAATPVSDITYGASEGRGTVFIGPDRQMLALRSHFFEFVKEEEMGSANARAYIADELEQGQSYFILFTTAGGLYRYNLNDIVKVVGFHNKTPLLEFQHKGGNISSFTGEKVTESQVTSAVSATMQGLNLKVAFFTVVPEFRPEPHYQLWLEPLNGDNSFANPTLLKQVSQSFDANLCRANSEYETKRQSQRLAGPQLQVLRSGTYESLRKSLVAGGVPDAQIKLSHLNPKADVKAYLQDRLAVPSSVWMSLSEVWKY